MILNKVKWYKNRLEAMSSLEILHRCRKKASEKTLKIRFTKKYTYINDFKYLPSVYNDKLPNLNNKFYFSYLDESLCSIYTKAFPDGIKDTLKVAEDICNGKLNLMGLGKKQLGKKINWHAGILTSNSWPMSYSPDIDFRQRDDIGDIRFTWEVNRHSQFVILAKAYFLTKQDKYLKCLISQFEDWIINNPVLIGVNWSSAMELAIRVNSWIWCYCFLDKFKEDEIKKLKIDLLKGINQHCLFIEKNLSLFSSANNHLIVEVVTLCIAGILFNEILNADKWLKTGINILKKELPIQVYKDGVNAEQAFHYQAFVMEALFLLVILASRNNIDLPESVNTSLKNMCGFIAEIIDKNGNVPNIGDSDDGHMVNLIGSKFNDYTSLLNLGAVVFGNSYFRTKSNYFNEQAFWILGSKGMTRFNDLKVEDKIEGSKIFKDGGYAVIKHKDSKKERIMLFDFAPLGLGALAAHGHADALSITLGIDGQEILVDPGTYIYNVERDWRDGLRSTSNHNTICINNSNQSTISGSFMWSKKASASLIADISNEQYEFYSAQHDGYKPIIHKRNILYMKPDLWIIQDIVMGSSSYEFDVTYNLNPDITIDSSKHNKLTLYLQNNKVLIKKFLSKTNFALSIKDIWISHEFGRKEKSKAIKLIGREIDNTVIYSIISFDEEFKALLNENNLEVSYRNKQIYLSSDENIRIK